MDKTAWFLCIPTPNYTNADSVLGVGRLGTPVWIVEVAHSYTLLQVNNIIEPITPVDRGTGCSSVGLVDQWIASSQWFC